MRMTRRFSSLLLVLFLLFSLLGCDPAALLPGGTGDDGDFTPTVFTEVLKTDFEKTYADQLSPNEKAIYDAVAELAPGTASVDVTLPELPTLCKGREPTEAETDALSDALTSFAANALYAVWLDHPTMFWLDHTQYSFDLEIKSDSEGVVKLSRLTLSLTLAASVDEIASQITALENAVKDFTPLGKTDAEKVAYINNYLCARIEYDLEAPNRGSIIGALVDGRCVCEGYARAFDFLCDKAGVDAVCIPGYGITDDEPEGEGHMWNGVFLDGALYAVDATWNDTTKKNSYLLVGTDTVCHDIPFGESHEPDMLMLEGPHKAFALPAVSKSAYGVNP